MHKVISLVTIVLLLCAMTITLNAPDNVWLLLVWWGACELFVASMDLLHRKIGALFHGDYWWEY